MAVFEAVNKSKFWIIWSIGSTLHRYETFSEAQQVCLKLVTDHPNEEYYILESILMYEGVVNVTKYQCIHQEQEGAGPEYSSPDENLEPIQRHGPNQNTY